MADASYSPRLRTALVLTGAGTAGAYQAGALGALAEAGVKVDLIAAHGPGIANAVIASADGGARLGAAAGPWSATTLAAAYRWRAGVRWAAASVLAAVVALALPLIVLVVAAGLYGASLLASLVNATTFGATLLRAYAQTLEVLFHPPILPTVIPRVMVLCMLVTGAVLAGAWWRARRRRPSRRRTTGRLWWELIGEPIDAREPAATVAAAVWSHVRGAATGASRAVDLGRKYVELVSENFGQPGFCDVVLAVHDLDARRDLVFGLMPEDWRTTFLGRRPVGALREAEVVDLTTSVRDQVADLVAGGLQIPGVTAGTPVTFPADAFWQGETHRVTDRPELVHRLLDEALGLGAEQVIFISAAPPAGLPHALGPRPVDLRGRAGEWQRAVETAVLDDAVALARGRFAGVFVIRPGHNPLGPFQFAGTYDETSDRMRTLGDLQRQGYEDAYRQFIEPVVATGEPLP